VVSPFKTEDVLRLSPEIPTFLVHSIGFTSMLRISAPTRCVVDTHPDTLIDLRLLNPWEELLTAAAAYTKDLDVAESDGGMDDHKHGHVPYLLLLLKYLEDWKASHGGKPPSTYSEKNEFKEIIRNKMRTNVPGGSEENYEEAMAAVLKNVRPAEIASTTKAVLEDPRCINPTADCESFWIIAHAVREFLTREDQGAGLLPLSGGFPDMKAESNIYIELQNL
jgi:amyloid beta precursor protein binding protein 1